MNYGGFSLKIGQYFNFNNLFFTLKHLFIYKSQPDIHFNCRLGDINMYDITSYIDKNNIKYVLLDKDNTISRPYSNIIEDKERTIITFLQNKIGYNNVLIVSNSIGSSDDSNRNLIPNIEKALDIRILIHNTKKPMIPLEVISKFLLNNEKNNNEYNIKTNDIKDAFDTNRYLVIGDRLMVDIYMAKHMNFKSVLIEPIDVFADNISVRLMRKIEKMFIRL